MLHLNIYYEGVKLLIQIKTTNYFKCPLQLARDVECRSIVKIEHQIRFSILMNCDHGFIFRVPLAYLRLI